MNLTILGSQGALPKLNKYSSSHLLEVCNKYILIDCCEGVQFQLRKNKIKLSKIEVILISHAHGDHFFGLIGLITTLSLLRRDKDLEVYCPVSVLKIIQAHLKYANLKLSYNLKLKGLKSNSSEIIKDDSCYSIHTIPLTHSVYTNGFLIKEKKKRRKLLLDKAIENNINKIFFNKLTKGHNVINKDGVEINYLDVTSNGDKPKSYAYCSDTAYSESYLNLIKEVDLLYCETTFLEKHRDKASSTHHSTTKDAGLLASKANVKKLLIGHFSSRYDNYDDFLDEVKQIFKNVTLSKEGRNIDI